MEMVPGRPRRAGHRRAGHPDRRHRRRPGLRRPGAGLAGRDGAAAGQDGALRQAVRAARPDPRAGRRDLRRGGRQRGRSRPPSTRSPTPPSRHPRRHREGRRAASPSSPGSAPRSRPGTGSGSSPTMGALHAGHASLVEQARALSDTVVVSIFVNPLQFGPGEDYARYPRPLEADLERCAALGVDLVFVPAVSRPLPAGPPGHASAPATMGTVLEGAVRPGHFDGVLTVVLKLLQPGPAPGRRLRPQGRPAARLRAADGASTSTSTSGSSGRPTVREPDGLALSSRNVFLSPADRRPGAEPGGRAEKAAAQSNAGRGARRRLGGAEQGRAWTRRSSSTTSRRSTRRRSPRWRADTGATCCWSSPRRSASTRLIDNTTLHYPEPIAPLAVPRLPSPR